MNNRPRPSPIFEDFFPTAVSLCIASLIALNAILITTPRLLGLRHWRRIEF